MTVSYEHAVRSINALSVGITAGVTGSPAIQDDNAQIARVYAMRGYSIYFPAGEYEFSDEILYDTETGVKVWGDSAILYQVTDNKRLFRFNSVTNLEVAGLHMRSPYYGRQTTNGVQQWEESLIMADQCENVRIHHNICEGYSCYAMGCIGGDTINICDNQFKDGNWDATNSNSADIAIVEVQAQPTLNAREIIVSRNQCNTMSLVGIMSLRPTRNFTCNDNMVISKDKNNNEIVSYLITGRKEGIQLQYHTDELEGNDDQDSSQYQMLIQGNQVQGCRYAGISCQSSTYFTQNSGGIRGTISNNLVRHCALEQTGPITEYVQNGITVNNCRDLIISNNVIKDIEWTTGNNGSAAIFVRHGSDTAPNTGGTLKTTIIEGNIIADCRSIGIRLHDVGDIIIKGNLLRDVERTALTMIETSARIRSGKMTLTDNVFVSALDFSGTRVILQGDDPDYIISNNRFEFTGTITTGNPYWLSLKAPKATVTGNVFIGPGSASTARGMYINVAAMGDPLVRFEEMIISDNSFKGFQYGYFLSNNDPLIGPIVHNNTVFVDVDRPVWNTQKYSIYAGDRHNVGQDDNLLTVYSDASPDSVSAGNWVVGDYVKNNNLVGATELGWICTGAGAGAASTWDQLSAPTEPPAGEVFLDTYVTAPTQVISATPTPVDIMDATDIADRVTATPATASLGIQQPGRYLLYFSTSLESSVGKAGVYITFQINGVDVDIPYRGWTRDPGESIQLNSTSTADISESDITAGGGEATVQMFIRGDGAATITYYNCTLGAVRTH
jgi:hypothetical protein